MPDEKKRRKRGICASRPKLEIAMLEAGIRTQTQLADRIAEQENRSVPPRDTVNRAFREEAVSPATISRIARALGVEPERLYKTETPQSPPTGAKPVPARSGTPKTRCRRLGLYLKDKAGEAFALSLQQAISAPLNAVLLNSALIDTRMLPADITMQYQADALLTIHCSRHGRHLGLRVFLYDGEAETLLWAAATHDAELQQLHAKLANACLRQLKHRLGLSTEPEPATVSLRALESYLQARELMEEHLTEINLRRAQTLLQDAIEDSPGFARAHAALAQALLDNSFMANERQLVEEAKSHCNQALSLAPDDVYARCVHSELLTREGCSDEAVELGHALLDEYPDHVDALKSQAIACLMCHEQNANADGQPLATAGECLTRACAIEPGYWRHHFDLGNYHFSKHEITNALQAFQMAADLKPNLASLLNLGTLYKCLGRLDLSEQSYRRAQQIDPENYAVKDMLGSLLYFREDFEQSARLKQLCLDALLPTETSGLHQMWGDLADALRHLHRWEEAVEAYRKALLTIERDQLSGYALTQDELYKEYYLLTLHRIDPERHPAPSPALDRERFRDFLEQDFYPSGYIKLAQIGILNGWPDLALRALDRAAEICPSFREHPDLKLLKQQYPLTPGTAATSN